MPHGDTPSKVQSLSRPRGRSRRRLRLWVAVCGVVMIAATAGSVLAARSTAKRDADRSAVEFTTAAAHVASTLQLAIQHEEDLIFSAVGFVAGTPRATKPEFEQWAIAVQALRRYPELLGLGQAVIVPRSQLAAFAKRTAPDGSFTVFPAGDRPFYCFAANGFSRNAASGFSPGLDLCAGQTGVEGLAARDSGNDAYIPFGFGPMTTLIVLSPVYRDGVQPATVAARRSEFVGWVGTQLLPNVMLERSLAGRSDLAVTFSYAAGASKAVFSSGTMPKAARSVTTDLHNGWTVRTYGPIGAVGVFADGVALIVLLGGIALSLVLTALLFVLATGRMRALSLVRQKTDELRHQALHDTLTDLPNRALIMDRIEHLLARNLRTDKLGAALYVDLDGFKNINDTLGHEAGDRLLEAVAARMIGTLRDADTIGRMGGDEFVILIDDVALPGAPEMVAERLLEVIRQPFHLAGIPTPMLITASVGIAVGHRETPEELLREADLALYQAKSAGKNCYEVFRPEMGTAVQHRYELEFDLRAALEGGQYRLVYQPIYNLDDLALVGVEALLRWDHPTLGRIEPVEFIPLLEQTGQIIEVGHWVLVEACTQMAAWRERGSDLTISVNVSARQLDRDVIVDHVRDALERSGLDPAALVLEVTETALMRNVDSTARRLGELKTLGVDVAIDDFGTGYSSLAYLQRFPVDCIKIDRSFTDAITRSPESDALVRTLVQLGKDLGLKTLAEGVESTEQIDYLRTQSVDEIQGFLLATPLAPEALETQIIDPARAINPRATHNV
jgi:diguanylate cyclase (GGDEF)-like protein